MTGPFQWFADGLVYGVLGLSADTRCGAALNFFVMDIPKIFFLLVVLIYVMGWLRAFVSPEQVRNYLSGADPGECARVLCPTHCEGHRLLPMRTVHL